MGQKKSKVYTLDTTTDEEPEYYEYDASSKDFNKFEQHIIDTKELICSSNKEIVSCDYIEQVLDNIKKDSNYFALCFYGKYIKSYTDINKTKTSNRPIAILFARLNKKKDTYIVYVLCRHKLTQKKGLGKQLLDKLEEKANSNGVKNIFLEAFKGTREAFYLQNGFKDDKKEIFTDSPFDESLFSMSKCLIKNKYITTHIFRSNQINIGLIKNKYLNKYKITSPFTVVTPKYESYHYPDKITYTLVLIENNIILCRLNFVLRKEDQSFLDTFEYISNSNDDFMEDVLITNLIELATILNVKVINIGIQSLRKGFYYVRNKELHKVTKGNKTLPS